MLLLPQGGGGGEGAHTTQVAGPISDLNQLELLLSGGGGGCYCIYLVEDYIHINAVKCVCD